MDDTAKFARMSRQMTVLFSLCLLLNLPPPWMISHAWIFQDILGGMVFPLLLLVSLKRIETVDVDELSRLILFFHNELVGFTISLMLKVLKAPSMSSPTLLLLTAFIYDVFFVFVTPYLTSTGESIMEAAATGAALTVKETIPMLFRVPSFRPNGGEAMLGFGDVVLPGILVTFLRECDARLEEDLSSSSVMLIGMDSIAARRTSAFLLPRSSRKEGRRRWSYYLTAILGYAVGLEVTFVAMMWSNQGQPALLYLVPCTVIPVVLLASKRHELSLLWNGWGGLDGEESEDDDGDEDRPEDESEKGKVLVI